MTPIEKASKLVSYYLPFCNDNLTDAKYCATIALDEIIEATNMYQYAINNLDQSIPSKIVKNPYWQQVKQELANI